MIEDDELFWQVLLQREAAAVSNLKDILDHSFPHQTNFITDPARLKTLFCTRRAAKSYTGGLGLCDAAQRYGGCNTLFIGLTRASAEDIVWKDVLKDINRKHGLGMTFNESKLRATFPNESVIHVTGVDAKDDEMEKLLGKKYKRIVIDEAASYTIDLRKLVYGILGPTTIDQGGDIWLMGTSGNLTTGLFFDITTGKEPGWKLFSWTAYDNPHIREKWTAEIQKIKDERPRFMETPLFRQWYLNEWVIDTDKLVYKFNRQRNFFRELPVNLNAAGWQYVLGVDLGHEDASAFSLLAFHENDPRLFVVEVFKKPKMDITDVANRIKHYLARYNIFRVIVDGANKQAVVEMQRRHSLALTAADKTGKADFIEIMNAEFIQGHIMVSEWGAEDVAKEYDGLIWDEKKLESSGKKEEHPNCENHAADATLYAWRHCYQYLSEAVKPKLNINKKDEWLAHSKRMMDEALERQIQVDRAKENEIDQLALMSAESQRDVLSYFLNKKRGS